jgi:hypothetical protein
MSKSPERGVRLRELLRGLVTVGEWNIGVAQLGLDTLVTEGWPTTTLAKSPPVLWLHKPWFVRFQADPCLLEYQGRLIIYYEEVMLWSTRGRLRCAELALGETSMRGSVGMMRLGHHAAYPYVFKHLNRYHCVPETGTMARVSLYGSQSPTGPWRIEAILLDGVSARDSTIFFFHDRWWLFCTVASAGDLSEYSDLHVWHAPELRGPWEPHQHQPVKVDISSSRPAGRPFIVEGELYRPAQDCLLRYGARVVINRVTTLTPYDFEEEPSSYLEPDPTGPYDKGLHTITSACGVLVLDGYRERKTRNPFEVAAIVCVKVRERSKVVFGA